MTGTGQSADVDWAEVERRGLRQQPLGVLLPPLVLGAIVLLTGKFSFWAGADAWRAIGVFVAVGLVLGLVGMATPRFRTRAREGFRLQYALRHHVDPGPELREKADRYAHRMAGNGWMAWFFPFIPVGFLFTGRWDRPLLAVPAMLVLLAAVVAALLWWRRMTAAAQRWADDPPGPAREPSCSWASSS